MFMPPVLAWLSNHMSSEACDEITYPFPNVDRWSLGMKKSFHPTSYKDVITYMLGLRLKPAYKRIIRTKPLCDSLDGNNNNTILVVYFACLIFCNLFVG